MSDTLPTNKELDERLKKAEDLIERLAAIILPCTCIRCKKKLGLMHHGNDKNCVTHSNNKARQS